MKNFKAILQQFVKGSRNYKKPKIYLGFQQQWNYQSLAQCITNLSWFVKDDVFGFNWWNDECFDIVRLLIINSCMFLHQLASFSFIELCWILCKRRQSNIWSIFKSLAWISRTCTSSCNICGNAWNGHIVFTNWWQLGTIYQRFKWNIWRLGEWNEEHINEVSWRFLSTCAQKTVTIYLKT